MREQMGANSRIAAGTHEPGALYIITLLSSTAPLPIQAPSAPELAGLAVFRSRRVEDGRDRYRLHLGYFETLEAAEATLQVVREIYPAAWIGGAPSGGLGSLDDTSVAQFKFIQAPKKPAGSAIAAVHPKAASAAKSAAPEKASQPVVPLMAPAEVLALLEPPPAKPPLQSKPAVNPAVPTDVAAAIQRFAVQLVWSMDPVDMTRVARLAIFDAYTLYKVQIDRVGRRWYGLRLGFFTDPVSARQVALYARSDFTAAAVVPVSDRECERAAQAAIMDTSSAVTKAKGKQPQLDMQLIDAAPRTLPAAKVAPVAARESRPAVKSTPVPKRAAEHKSQRTQAARTKTPGRSRSRTTEELISELGVDELSLAGGGNDSVNDSGVRHLSISVVRSNSNSRLGRLFSRGTRRRS